MGFKEYIFLLGGLGALVPWFLEAWRPGGLGGLEDLRPGVLGGLEVLETWRPWRPGGQEAFEAWRHLVVWLVLYNHSW